MTINRAKYNGGKQEHARFDSINYMRESFGLPLLKKGWVDCICGCGTKFFTFNTQGNRMCADCKAKPQDNVYQDFDNAYTVGRS